MGYVILVYKKNQCYPFLENRADKGQLEFNL